MRWHRVPADAAAAAMSAAGVGPEAAPGVGRGAAARGYLVRDAQPGDLDAIAAFEIEIARASFGDDAVTDADLHRRRVQGSMGKPGEVMLVAMAEPAPGASAGAATSAGAGAPAGAVTSAGAGASAGPGTSASPPPAATPAVPLGWAWMSGRTNSLTGERYGNFRSLAVADTPDRSLIGELLMAAVVQAAEGAGLRHVTGKVQARNLGMRTLYRKFGFEATHVTMEKWAPANPGPAR
jgi:GNAT superfamily N-acetyltransferase